MFYITDHHVKMSRQIFINKDLVQCIFSEDRQEHSVTEATHAVVFGTFMWLLIIAEICSLILTNIGYARINQHKKKCKKHNASIQGSKI